MLRILVHDDNPSLFKNLSPTRCLSCWHSTALIPRQSREPPGHFHAKRTRGRGGPLVLAGVIVIAAIRNAA
ncbi:hypothetical protein BOTBODRAFT_32046 [Botryobasidium botryosum FD-172 SS1]|uniref:Uncharacterized protein n=1 Tax=Botryobasidium botryosum (strain FD-172 SS1) TaxID=930990 RepID=A0A067MJY1_BOTB1|nr:hypothetical protein BOTBODRAFT_32046 [Botryobasidium botryosum FD-172 SS1]